MNSINCMVFVGVGISGGWLSVGAPNSMYGLSLAKHVQGMAWHWLWSNHGGTVFSCSVEFWLPTFMRV